MTASWEDASRCPIHQIKGVEQSRRTMEHGEQRGTIITLTCPQTGNCEYDEVGWMVQIRPDGTIPDATTAHEKNFDPMPGWQKERARDRVENLREEMEQQLRTGGGRLVDGGRRYL